MLIMSPVTCLTISRLTKTILLLTKIAIFNKHATFNKKVYNSKTYCFLQEIHDKLIG